MANPDEVLSVAMDSGIDWPEYEPIPHERVVSGQPATSTLVLHKSTDCELGLWRVTPGRFASRRTGLKEMVTIYSGLGRLNSDDGTVVELRPGVVVVIPDGWTGAWEIDTELVKSYALVSTKP